MDIDTAAEKISEILTRDASKPAPGSTAITPRTSFRTDRHRATKERAKRGREELVTKTVSSPETPVIEADVPAAEDSIPGPPVEEQVAQEIECAEPLPGADPIPIKTCTCGAKFERYAHGATFPDICLPCLKERAKEGLKRARLAREKKAGSTPQWEQEAKLIFRERDRHIYEAVCKAAELERRSPENQLLWMLENDDRFLPTDENA